MKITKVTDSIVLITEDADELGARMMRFQEHYESSSDLLRGKIFTTGYAKHIYSQLPSARGASTYELDWSGYNFPSYVLAPFIQGLFDPLTEPEAELVEMLRYRTDKFYVIGAGDDDDAEQTTQHETMHGLWYTVPAYQAECLSAMESFDLSYVKRKLLDWSYANDESILIDESHAYISSDFEWCVTDEGWKIEELEPLHKSLFKIYSKYIKKLGKA